MCDVVRADSLQPVALLQLTSSALLLAMPSSPSPSLPFRSPSPSTFCAIASIALSTSLNANVRVIDTLGSLGSGRIR